MANWFSGKVNEVKYRKIKFIFLFGFSIEEILPENKNSFLLIWQDLFCRKIVPNERVEDVNFITFLVTEHAKSYRKVNFSTISYHFRATEQGLRCAFIVDFLVS